MLVPRPPGARRIRSLLATLAVLIGVVALAPPAAAQGGESFSGTLVADGDEPVAGSSVNVTDAAGESVGEAVTADDGSWVVELPGPGTYSATIDATTLPEGVALRDPDRSTLGPINVRAGQQRTLTFLLGEGAGGRSLGEDLAQATVNGLKFGLIIAMAAVGLSLIFGTTGLINFAHGELVTFGAATAWYLNAESIEAQLLIAAVLATILSGVLGATLETGLLRPLRDRGLGSFQFVVVTIGLSLFGRQVFQLWIGEGRQSFRDYTIQDQIDFGPFGVTPRDLIIMTLAAVSLVGVATMLQRTRVGKGLRAVSDNADLAEASGINVNRITLVVWMLGASLAGLGGVFLGAVENIQFEAGFRLLLLIFAAVILGGLGTAYGAMAGGLVIGLATEVSTVWVSPELKFVVALVVLIVVLLARPQGILGIRERVG